MTAATGLGALRHHDLTTVLAHDGGPVEKEADQPQQDADDNVEQVPHGLPYTLRADHVHLRADRVAAFLQQYRD